MSKSKGKLRFLKFHPKFNQKGLSKFWGSYPISLTIKVYLFGKTLYVFHRLSLITLKHAFLKRGRLI